MRALKATDSKTLHDEEDNHGKAAAEANDIFF